MLCVLKAFFFLNVRADIVLAGCGNETSVEVAEAARLLRRGTSIAIMVPLVLLTLDQICLTFASVW